MAVPADWFKTWFDSPYYHKLYFERNETEATQSITRLLAYLQPPTDARMVDIACGRGRHARILAAQGGHLSMRSAPGAGVTARVTFGDVHLP